MAEYAAGRLGGYLSAANRAPTDGGGASLTPAIDDTLRALGYAEEDIATAEPTEAEAVEDVRVQLIYRALLQLVRDLGATMFNVGTGGDSYSLRAIRDAAYQDVQLAQTAVLERFGTLGIVPSDADNPFITIDTNYLEDSWAELTA